MALVGKLPPTLASRSIHIRQDRIGHLKPLLQQAARFAADNATKLHLAEPDMPEAFYGRAADNWRPLLAIADAAADGDPFDGLRLPRAAIKDRRVNDGQMVRHGPSRR